MELCCFRLRCLQALDMDAEVVSMYSHNESMLEGGHSRSLQGRLQSSPPKPWMQEQTPDWQVPLLRQAFPGFVQSKH